jgi:2-polyprenyl-3-methyl-5-hydroxy-6-metoxy-1,4-benzoquinol methylase
MEINESGPTRDIEKELLSKERKHRRPKGHAVYCFPYTKDMVDFDNWDYMFQTKYCFRGGLTMNQFDTPPRSVLDLGCGGGLWVIEAAKQWKVKNCTTYLILYTYKFVNRTVKS